MSDENTDSKEPNFEELARADGWKPKEEFKGDPNRWVDAKTFVERGATILPIVQAKLQKKFEEVDELKKKMEEQQGVFSEFQKFQEQAITKERKEKEALLSQLEEQRAKAITDGDGATFTQVDRQIRAIQSQGPQIIEEPIHVKQWKAENNWYGTDRDLTAVADGLSDVLAAENPGLKGRAFLDKLTERVKATVPHKFSNPRRDEQITIEGRQKGSQGRGKTYDDLPAEARSACDRFVKTIPGFTKEQYLSQYRWEQ